jgi:hypothetical protein
MDDISIGLRRSFFIIVCFLVSQSANATNYFTWNADSSTTSNGHCTLTGAGFVAGAGHDGGTALRIDVQDGYETGTHGCPNDAQLDLGLRWDSGKTLYFRWWMRLGAFNFGTRNTMKSGRLLYGSTGDFTMHLNSARVWVESAYSNNPPCGGGDCPGVNYNFLGQVGGNWHEYIMALTLQTGSATNDAKTELFVDGVSQGYTTGYHFTNCSQANCSDVALVASVGNAVMQAPYMQLCVSSGNCGAGGTIWVDDFSVDDRWNSTVGPQPNPPTLLPVQ